MTVAQDIRYRKAARAQFDEESRVAIKAEAEVLVRTDAKIKSAEEWLHTAKAFMVDSAMFQAMVKHQSRRRDVQNRHAAIVAAHCQFTELPQETRERWRVTAEYCQSVYAYIKWVSRGTSYGNGDRYAEPILAGWERIGRVARNSKV
jgi:hypothetical protein